METTDDNVKRITVRGKEITIGRLTVTRQINIFFDDLSPKLLPIAGEVADRVGPLFGYGRLPQGTMGLNLADLLTRAVRELPAAKFMELANKVLEKTTYGGQPLMGQVDLVFKYSSDLMQVVLQAVLWMYSDFSEGLASHPFVVLARAAYEREASKAASTSSTPPSSESSSKATPPT